MADGFEMKPVARAPAELIASTPAAEAPQLSARLFVLIERLLLVGGLLLLVWLVRQMGVAAIWRDVWSVGYGFIFVVGQELIAYVGNTFGWYFAFPSPRPRIPFTRL